MVPLQDILHLVSLVGLLLCLGLHPIAIKRRKTHQGSANFINKKVKNVPGYLAKFLDFLKFPSFSSNCLNNYWMK